MMGIEAFLWRAVIVAPVYVIGCIVTYFNAWSDDVDDRPGGGKPAAYMIAALWPCVLVIGVVGFLLLLLDESIRWSLNVMRRR